MLLLLLLHFPQAWYCNVTCQQTGWHIVYQLLQKTSTQSLRHAAAAALPTGVILQRHLPAYRPAHCWTSTYTFYMLLLLYCRQAWYCNVTCQQTGWRLHKNTCKQLRLAAALQQAEQQLRQELGLPEPQQQQEEQQQQEATAAAEFGSSFTAYLNQKSWRQLC
jgi:hypothetical protein